MKEQTLHWVTVALFLVAIFFQQATINSLEDDLGGITTASDEMLITCRQVIGMLKACEMNAANLRTSEHWRAL